MYVVCGTFEKHMNSWGVGCTVLTSRMKKPPLVAWVTTHPGSHFSGLAPRWFVRLHTHIHIHIHTERDVHTHTHPHTHTSREREREREMRCTHTWGEVEECKGREGSILTTTQLACGTSSGPQSAGHGPPLTPQDLPPPHLRTSRQ